MNKFDFGQFIKNVRETRKLDLEFCSSNLKIHKKFLDAIENNNYKIFDNYFQAQGFVQNYLEFLEIKVADYIPRWRKEYYEEFDFGEESTRVYYKPKKKRIYNFSLSLNKLVYIGLGLIVTLFLGYVFYSYQALLNSPTLEITNPKSNVVVEADLVDVFGKTDQDAILKINNEKLTIQTDGNFATSLKLSEGINNFKFSSINPFGKETVKVLTVIYRPRRIEIYNPPVENSSTITSSSSRPEVKVTTSPASAPTQKVSTSPASKVLTNPKNSIGN